MKRIDLRTQEDIDLFFAASDHVIAEELSKAIVINDEGQEVALRCEAGQAISLVSGIVEITSPSVDTAEDESQNEIKKND